MMKAAMVVSRLPHLQDRLPQLKKTSETFKSHERRDDEGKLLSLQVRFNGLGFTKLKDANEYLRTVIHRRGQGFSPSTKEQQRLAQGRLCRQNVHSGVMQRGVQRPKRIVMHSVRCHAKRHNEAELAGQRGQYGRRKI
jgi:hypothetical protein